MHYLGNVKQRILREAVEENLVVIRNVRPGVQRRRRAPRLVKSALLVVAPFSAWMALTSGPGDAAAEGPFTRAGAAAARSADIALAAPEATFAAPRPVDPAVFPLAVRKIVLDPGHGGENRGTAVPFGLVEKDLTLDLAGRLQALLAASGFEVVFTRRGDDNVSLRRRTEIANAADGDIFVSIHVNWIEQRGVRGVETYYLGPTDDPYLESLAAAENRGSGYSLADLRSLLDQMYADVRQAESRRLAQAVHQSLFTSLRAANPAVENRGVKTAPFVVLTATEMPAILAEVSCLSNDEEAAMLQDAGYRQTIAKALFSGVRAYAEARAETLKKGS
jgi:N-acetylmuramoyl-L-alanine amidase